jgi:hypothetical protein
MLRIAHIINPFLAAEGTEMQRIQPITFETMRRAKQLATDVADVELLAAVFPEDSAAVPDDFTTLSVLLRSFSDVCTQSKRRLPLLHDILDAAIRNSNADYIIYTNADIALMPVFYRMVAQYASKGYDAFVINRRRISGRYRAVSQLDEMYAEAGAAHSGFDTFVFKRELFHKFSLGNIAIGLPYVDMTMMHNLYAYSKSFRLFTGKHLTFHIGMELVKNWGSAAETAFNKKEALRIVKGLYSHYEIGNFPGASRSLPVRHFKWLMNPTFHYPTMFRLDFSQLSKPRRKPEKQITSEADQRWLEWLVKQANFDDEW